MSFYYMLLGHLIGDFVLQTDQIAHNKVKLRKWNALHAAIVTVCMLLFSLPFGVHVIGAVFVSGILHYYIDWYKPRISKRHPLQPLVYFLLDQGVHISILYVISIFAYPIHQSLLQSPFLIKLMLATVFLTSFCSVLNQFIVKMLVPVSETDFFKDGEKITGNLTRLLIAFSIYFSVIYSVWFFLLMIVVLLNFLYKYKTVWKSWMNRSHLIAKIGLDMVAALIGAGLLFHIK